MIKNLVSKILIFTISFSTLAIVNTSPAFAAASLYLSPANATVTTGATFSVSIYTNTGGDNVNGVEAHLVYPTSTLQFQSIDATGSAFEVQAINSGAGGSVEVTRGTVTPKSGTLFLAKVTFKAVATGSANVSFTSQSLVSKPGGVNILGSTTGGSYNIVASSSGSSSSKPTAPFRSSKQTSTTSTTTTSGSPSSSEPATEATPKKEELVISDIKVASIGPDSATITWKTNIPADSTVKYGLTKNLEFTKTNNELTTNHEVVLDSQFLTPGLTYYYQSVSKDEAGNVREGKVLKFTTKGYTVEVRVLDDQGEPLAGLTVVLSSEPRVAITDENGVATFNDVSSGEHSVAVVFEDGLVKTSEIEVEKDDIKDLKIGKAVPQRFDVKVSPKDYTVYYSILGILMILVLVLSGYLFYHRFTHTSKVLEDKVIG